MLVAAAVCPCPPLLLPEAAAGAAPELDALRAACDQAVQALRAARPDLLIVVGAAEPGGHGRDFAAGARADFRAFGVDVAVRLGPDGDRAEGPELPPSAAVGAWLLERADWSGPCAAHCPAADAPAADCLATGRELAARAPRTALLVMGDGSACRSLKAPGYLDDRAEGFDASVAAALGAADTAALAGLDVRQAAELQARGRAPWQVLAGAAEGAYLDGRLLREEAPYGVGYFVAVWS
ncbi:class III extradiol ring-cleavage dioxygenase family protein [Peterkaempfera bronchialis]|uniref:Extradiol ring-cleavage dioxygenase class III enzyme subunit B domain-containing protein n=1 Tax=Peterkaempfera bronchialis TaxID=2126346 RepID=A0A345T178_9ACTN|nr:hypothetical protein [Peterkaempfera bronchialis]AXI79733.1 hypothetical protein C7M71_022350 [Peterkaempfera bronchialis]